MTSKPMTCANRTIPQDRSEMPAAGYTVHLCPPAYPKEFNPFHCAHAPTMHISATHVLWDPKGRGKIVVEHARCLACGAAVGTGTKGNIFVDIACLMELDICAAGPLRQRLREMKDIYLLRAEILFGESGWLGDEDWRELAELIDPHLTMRVFNKGTHSDGTRFLGVHIDEDYWPDADPEAPEPAQGELSL